MKARLYPVLNFFCDKKWLARLSNRAVRVYIALLRHYNWQEGAAWPGVPTLREETGLSERSVRYAIKELRKFGLCLVERAQRRRANHYRLPNSVPDMPPELFMPPRLRRRMERAVRCQTRPRKGATECTLSEAVEVQPTAPQGCNSSCTSEVQTSAPEVLSTEQRIEQRKELRQFVVSKPENSTPPEPDRNRLSTPPEPDRNRLIADYRKLYETIGGSPDAVAGVRRNLASKLRVTEEEAAALLDGARSS